MRLRITFAKTEAMRFTSHLDLYRAWERTFRRAGLPLAYTQGFKPHPKINLASALPLGFTSEGEILDAVLEYGLQLPKIKYKLVQALPPGLKIIDQEEVEMNAASLQKELDSSEYIVTLLDPVPNLGFELANLLRLEQIIRERREKSYDLRPLILKLSELPNDDDGFQRSFLQMTSKEGATGRPDELAAALGVSIGRVRIHRTRLIFSQEKTE